MVRTRRRALALLITAGIAGALGVPAAPAAAQSAPVETQAQRADDFVASLGVATHVTYPGEYADKAMLERRILESGLRRVRASWGPEDTANRDLAVRLGRRGIKIMFWTGQIGSDLDKVKRAIVDTNTRAPGTIDAIEGPNEQDGDPRLRDFVRQYSTLLRSDPATAGLRIYGPSLADVGNRAPYDALGDLSAWVDAANVHDYPGGRMMSDEYIDSMYAFTQATTPGRRAVIASELGYSNATDAAVQPHPAVPKDVSAVLVPRLYLEHFRRGIPETYVYELVDESAQTPWEGGFGLLHSDGSPKPAFTAVQNLTGLLADPGPAFSPGRLEHTLRGTDPATRSLLLQKRDGSFWLALWQQSEVWDRVTRTYTRSPDRPVQLTLAAPASVTTYRPTEGTAVRSTSTGTTHVLSSGTSPTLVRIDALPPVTAQPGPVAAPADQPVVGPVVPPGTDAAPAPAPPAAADGAVVPRPAQAWSVRINAGGGEVLDTDGRFWSADTGYEGGQVHRAPDTPLPALNVDSRYGARAYRVPVPAAGDYRVRLHTSEPYWSRPGQRVFSAAAEGSPVFEALDLVATVGPQTPAVREAVVRVEDGTLDVTLDGLVNHATLDALEVLATGEAPAGPGAAPAAPATRPVAPLVGPPTAPAAPVPGPVSRPAAPAATGPWSARINAGGPRLRDGLGRVWQADTAYRGGRVYRATARTSGPVPAVSSDGRAGDVTYDVRVPAAGVYVLRVHLTETYWRRAGKRLFDVRVEGRVVAGRVDLAATTGKNRTRVVQVPVRVADGGLTVQLRSLRDKAVVSGLEVVRP